MGIIRQTRTALDAALASTPLTAAAATEHITGRIAKNSQADESAGETPQRS